MAASPLAHASKPAVVKAKSHRTLSHNLFGEWRENCIKALDISAKDEAAPFVMFKMIVGWDGSIEYNYSYYSDDKCTKRKSMKREWAKYQVLESHDRRAKLLVRKDLEGGMISESVVELHLPSINRMSSKVLNTKIEFDDLLTDEVAKEETDSKDQGNGESAKNLSRFVTNELPAPKAAEKPKSKI